MQTAVERLRQRLRKNFDLDAEDEYHFSVAIEEERKNIVNAYRCGKAERTIPTEELTTGEQYYNETFRK